MVDYGTESIMLFQPGRLRIAALRWALCALPQVERETSALRRARTEVQAPFDLERGPLLRVRVLRLDKQMYWLLLTLHHIVTDGWSWQYRRV